MPSPQHLRLATSQAAPPGKLLQAQPTCGSQVSCLSLFSQVSRHFSTAALTTLSHNDLSTHLSPPTDMALGELTVCYPSLYI